MINNKIEFNEKNTLIKIIVIILLSILAFISNIIDLNIYGINFSILSCVLLVMLKLYGLRYAGVVIISILTINHFNGNIDSYKLLIVFELIFIGILNKKDITKRLFLKDVIYWITFLSLIFILSKLNLFYINIEIKFYILSIIINGLLNALIADIIITYIPINFITEKNKNYTIKIKDIVFHILCISMVIPFAFNFLLSCRSVYKKLNIGIIQTADNSYYIARERAIMVDEEVNKSKVLVVIALFIFILIICIKKVLQKDIKNLLSIVENTPNNLREGEIIQWSKSNIEELNIYICDLELMIYRFRCILHKSEELNKMLEQQAYTDSLTGLRNRLSLKKYLDEIERECDKKFVVVLMDINKFKLINDTLGHSVGDELLLEVSSRLITLINSKTNIFRVGGDEFIIIKEKDSEEDLHKYGERILDLFKKGFSSKDIDYKIETSVGISIYPDDNKDINVVIRYADIAMYKAKENGYGYFEIFNNSMIKDFEEKGNKL